MIRRKNNIVVGLTTFYNEKLRISIPALSKLPNKFTLIIYNDNPMTTISKRQIRRLGYCGDLLIINTNENLGELSAKLNIINAANEIKSDWIVFCNDDDLLIDLEIPSVSCDNFAIIQNAVILRHKVSNLLRVMENPSNFDIDGENVELARPNIGILGTPIRAKVLFGLSKIITDVIDKIKKIDEKLDYYPPISAILWNFVNIYTRNTNPNAAPIYMDKINYIKNSIDTSRIKYGKLAQPARNADEQYRRALEKYETILQSTFNSAAAPRG